MSKIILNGHNSTGHGCWPARPVIASASKTFINNTAVALNGDTYIAHTCPAIPETHSGTGISGASKTYIEGKKILRNGDAVSCGDTCAGGSNNTFAE